MFKKTLSLMIVSLTILAMLCGAASAEIKLTYWHSMGGAAGEGIAQMVADFNASQSEIVVEEQFHGSYDDAITKLKSSGANQGPDIMQLYDIGTRWMIDSGYALVMQDIIDKNGYDTSVLEPNIAGYYTVDGKLHCMPFNSSTPLMYYNKDAFAAAGLDPATPPKNFEELRAAAETLTNDDVTGMTMQVYSWLFEQYTSKQAKHYANNGNGRDAHATAVEFDSNGAGIAFLTALNEMTQAGVNGNMGRDGTAITNAFAAEKTFIIFGSTASLPSILKAVDGAFELGTAPLPNLIADVNGGVSIGGAALWIMDKNDAARADAAWKFIEYAVSPEFQIYWHKVTGYFPVTTKSYDLQEMKDQMVQNPLFVTAIDQLHASPVSARGALVGVFTEARNIVEANWEEMYAGKLTPEQVVEQSAQAINSAIEMYNIANS